MVDPGSCPRCGEFVQTGPRCEACRSPHHVECARTFGRCAAEGCGADLPGAPAGRPAIELPRLPTLARRIGAWRVDDLGDPGPAAVVLLPGEASGEAAQTLAEVLGSGAYEARSRLGVAYPEPLVRVPDAAQADGVVAALAKVGVRALALPLAELLAPLAAHEAVDVKLGNRIAFADDAGAAREQRFGERRLVVVTQQVVGRKAGGSGGFSRSALAAGRGAATQGLAFVFLEADAPPVVLREQEIRDYQALEDRMTMSSAHNFELLTRLLGDGGGERVALPKELAEPRYVVNRPEGSSNYAPAALVARLEHRAWGAAAG